MKNNQLYLYICIYDISAIIDQSWKKKIEKYFISSCLRELKIRDLNYFFFLFSKRKRKRNRSDDDDSEGDCSDSEEEPPAPGNLT